MSTKFLLRPLFPRTFRSPGRRTFISIPGTEPQSLRASRILPYKASSIYTLISDVESYSTFVPFCQESRVTEWSNPAEGRRWPQKADLKVGWGGYEESYTSCLYCIPNSVVEALSGDATTSLPRSSLQHHTHSKNANQRGTNEIFKSLSTKWVVKPLQNSSLNGQLEQTEVHLTIDFQFANPLYAALSKAITPQIAGIMIEAFEKRAKKMLQ